MAATKVSSSDLLSSLLSAKTTTSVQAFLEQVPVVDEATYMWTEAEPAKDWEPGKLHWIPVGRERGNAGRIQLAGDPYNPAAERLINGMEAIIELARQKELLKDPLAAAPQSPREAVARYFELPRLELIPRTKDKDTKKKLEERVKGMRERLSMRLDFDKKLKQFAVEISDRGIGQAPARIHQTLLSLGQTDKADKLYLIGVFGQGGSSTYAASQYSIVMSRRAADFLDGRPDGIGWTIVRKITPKNRRDPYFAYLAEQPDGQVPFFSTDSPAAERFPHGTLFRHIGYDFGRQGSAVAMTLFYALNHVLFSPVLPYNLYALKDSPDAMHGTGYRLARQTAKLEGMGAQHFHDNAYQPHVVGEIE